MNKSEFIEALKKELSGLPQRDIDSSVDYYCEMIDDRIEDGIPEDEAVLAVGAPKKIAEEIISDTSFSKVIKLRVKNKRKLSALEIVLLAVGSPIWLSLAISVVAVVISAFAVLWSAVVSLWATDVALAASTLGALVLGIVNLAFGNLFGIFALGVSLLCAGASIFMFYLCRLVTRYVYILCKKIIILVKKCFLERRKSNEAID